ncbi:hypothetical protein KEM55_002060 [Ascosphaera atra]|nr:hypothetical protein KEM55_002060 [Ascosphaera atra]
MSAQLKPSEVIGSQPQEDAAKGWDSLWLASCTPWDRGEFSPALRETLLEVRDILGGPFKSASKRERKKALVPGCGRGWDVLLLASFGYDAYGLDVSGKAIEACRELEKKTKEELQAYDEAIGKGKATFVQGDYFENAWLESIDVTQFEVIYDYTFFCAINPALRPNWAARASELLAPAAQQGRLICLEWPRAEAYYSGGPPYASPSAAYEAHLRRPGEEIPYDDVQGVQPIDGSNKLGFEKLAHFKPRASYVKTTHENGNVEERVSIWQKLA